MAENPATGKALADTESGPAPAPTGAAKRALQSNPARTAILCTAWLLGILIIGTILVFGQNVLIPLAVAIMIWHMINAIANRYAKISINGRSLPGWASLMGALATIAVGCWLVVDLVSANVAQVSESAPLYQENLQKLSQNLPSWAGLGSIPTLEELISRVNIGDLIGQVTSAFGALLGNAGLVGLYVMFLLLEQATFERKIDALFTKPGRADQVRAILAATEQRIERYLWIKTLMSLLTAGLCFIVLSLVGVDYPGFWALIIFLFNFIPNIGSAVAVILPCLLALLQFGSLATTVLLALALGFVQFFVGSVIEPRFMGNSLNLSPLVIMLSLTLWGSIWGLAGMVLCVPMTVILAILCSQFKATQPIAVILSSDGRIR